jgi:hypothetical protein
MRQVGHVMCMGELRNAYKLLVVKREGMKPLGRPMHIWEHNVKMDHRETGLEGMDWIYLA